MNKVTGIGGIFIKAKNPKELAAWYEKHLGIEFGGNTWINFEWINKNNPSAPGSTVFSFFEDGSKYFEPSDKKCMLNFRVKNLNELLNELRKDNVWVDEKTQEHEYGKFGWIMDPEGNKIELWEPAE